MRTLTTSARPARRRPPRGHTRDDMPRLWGDAPATPALPAAPSAAVATPAPAAPAVPVPPTAAVATPTPAAVAAPALPAPAPAASTAAPALPAPAGEDHAGHPASALAGGPSLADLIDGVWDGLADGAPAACPVCAGEMVPRWSAGAGVVGGRCGDCGTTLD